MRHSGLISLLVSWLVVALVSGCSPEKSVGLTFSTWGSIDEIEILKPILEAFTRQSGIPVELVHIPQEYAHKLRLMVAGQTIPDVMFISNEALPGFAERGVFRDLGPLIAQDPAVRLADYYQQVLAAMTWKGKLYGIPRDLSNLVVFYNKQIFAQAKVPYPRAGWTFADLLRIAPRLTKPGERWAIGFQPNPLVWTPYVWSFGGDIVAADLSRCTLTEAPALAGLRFYVDLRNKYHYAPSDEEAGNARMTQLFATGKLAMFVYGRWAVPNFRKKITFPWDVAPFPRGPAGSIVDTDASGWAIAAASRRPAAAWQLVKFLGSRWSIEQFTKSGLIVPSRPDVASSPAFLANIPEHSHVFLDVIPQGRPTRVPVAYDEITWELIDELGPAWTGEVPIEEAVLPLCKRITALLREAS
ncbi:MAG: sugar ABC transporter substrate-binding protein [Cyanobacteria bacterium NC_groundwater_1444_Ag_S-0.65um_54_12]|nr:sugar ABC transporter substrate-binding protein [Cyanobacteria bacterium NC_groundwater_1444_Ag_S-0.65um_54_12]